MAQVVVVGGGIGGLTTAYRLQQAGVDVEVREAATCAGGRLLDVEVAGLTLEAGADSFLARKPWAVDLCRELRVPLVTPGSSGAYLWTDAGLVRYLRDAAFGIPGDIGDVLRWPGLSRSGRLRAARDLVAKKRKDGADETLGGLLRRRLGDEATDLAIAPLLAGLYAGDVDRLSARATFPELVAWESYQGSLVRGSQAARRVAAQAEPGPIFVKPRGGVARLTDALADRLADRLHTGAPVAAVPASAAVVLATSAIESARLLDDVAPDAARELDGIAYASTAVVLLVYPDGTAGALPEGTGFVVPRGKAPMTACTWISNKWPDPAFRTRAIVRCYVGAAGEEDVLDASDDDIVGACVRHLAAVLDLPSDSPDASVHRWPRSMPQYERGHLERVQRAREALPPGIFLVGNAYDGVGIPDTVRGANDAAERVTRYLGITPRGSDPATTTTTSAHDAEETVR